MKYETKINIIKIGDCFKNYKNESFVVNKVSKTGLVVIAKNIAKNITTMENMSFRWYEESGKYISGATLELGDYFPNMLNTTEVNNQCKIVLKKQYR